MIENEEAKKLSETLDFIDREISRLTAASGERKEAVRARNRDFMAENPFGSVYGAAVDMIRHNENDLAEAEAMRREAYILDKMRLAPYFGRVDFRYDDDGETERIYVGIKTLTDGKTFFVYDWRAPVSALFYLGELGRAAYTAPAGEIAGEILLLRQYTFENGALAHHWDAELHIDDEVLRGVLSGASGQAMRPIVCTIQREQNAAIRFAANRDLLVTGPAGCGKTSIGMHRLAWLMYRARSESMQVSTLMLTSNEAFRSYLSGVLPELGERNAESFSFADLFERYLPGFRVESALGQAEALLSGNAQRAADVAALYDPAFLSYIESQLDALQPKFVSVVVLGQTALEGEEIARRFRALPGGVPLRERLETLADWVEEELKNYLLIHRKEILAHLLETTERGDSYTEKYMRLKKQVAERSRAMVLNAVPTDPAGLLMRYCAAYKGGGFRLQAMRNRIACKDLRFEEAVMLLFLSARLGNCRPFGSYTHVLVDEAQDLCPAQHKTLRLLFPKAVFTVLADPNQGVLPVLNTGSAARLAEIYRAESLAMGKSYRSTREIGEYAKSFLPEEKRGYEMFDRQGSAPVVWTAADPVRKTAELLRELAGRYRTVCVLLKTTAEVDSFYEKLQPLYPDCAPVLSEKKALSGSVLLMPAMLAKGLEFDCVLVPVFAAAPPDDRLMYLFATRALHALHVIREKTAAR